MKNYPVKENLIGSAVSEILQYKQTDKQSSFYFIKRILLQIVYFRLDIL